MALQIKRCSIIAERLKAEGLNKTEFMLYLLFNLRVGSGGLVGCALDFGSSGQSFESQLMQHCEMCITTFFI